jgi:hypothetical protein
LLEKRQVPEGSKSSNFTFNNPFKPVAMKQKILLLALSAALISGCSTAYQAGQTPDDVYYSPARQTEAREETRREEKRQDRYEQYVSSEDDNYLRMRIRNRNRWSTIDDFDYWYNPNTSYYYNNRTFGNYNYNPYVYNNWYSGYYNPYVYNNWYGRSPYFGHPGFYAPVYVIKNPVRTNVSRPSLGGYSNKNYNNNNSNFGNMMKRVFTPSTGNNATYNNSNSSSRISNNNSSSRTYEPPSRTYNPSSGSSNNSGSSSSGSSSSSSGSSSGGTVTRPPRGN